MITLKTLPQASAQEVFDQVAEHLLTQNEQSYGDDMCRYRSFGLKCAAGSLIGHDEYQSMFEGKAWNILTDKGLVPAAHQDLIVSLQMVHDDFSPKAWRRRLQITADKYGLDPSVVDNFPEQENSPC